MSDTTNVSFPQAARRIGVTTRVLRHAIRSGSVPAPPYSGATASLPATWLSSAQAAVEASPTALRRVNAQKVAPFARYEGTSAWRKYTRRVREYARFQAKAKQTGPG